MRANMRMQRGIVDGRGYDGVMRLLDVIRFGDGHTRVTMNSDVMWWLCIGFVVVHVALEFLIPFAQAASAVILGVMR